MQTTTTLALGSLLLLGACSESDPSQLPDDHVGAQGKIPEGAPTAQTGPFQIIRATAPGAVEYLNAGLAAWDPSGELGEFGSGSVRVMIDGVSYEGAIDTFSVNFPEVGGSGTEYLALQGIFRDDGDLAMVVDVVVPASDFAPGATVMLDGFDRVAMFTAGPVYAPEPEVLAGAVSGTVTFTGGSLGTGGSVSATISADFGPIEF